MPNSTVPASATALPITDPFLDFAADDTGAMVRVIADEQGTHVTRTLGGEQQRNFVAFKNYDLTGELACATVTQTTGDPQEPFLVAFMALIAAPWPSSHLHMQTIVDA